MTTDELNTAIDLYKTGYSEVGSLWGLYAGAALALLGYMLGSKDPVPGRAKIGLAIVFLAFAIANARSLSRAQGITYEAYQTLSAACQPGNSSVSESEKRMFKRLEVSRPACVVGFQAFFTTCALLTIYWSHKHETWKTIRSNRS